MSTNIPELGLQKRNRLEPSELLLDTGAFEEQSPPFSVVFFTGSQHDRAQHDSPILHITGMSFDRWGVDTLHSLHMGPFSTAVSFCLRKLLETDIWRPAICGLDQTETAKLALCGLKCELWQFYKTVRATHSSRTSAARYSVTLRAAFTYSYPSRHFYLFEVRVASYKALEFTTYI